MTLACPTCGATFLADDEFCEACGARVADATERDHRELVGDRVAAITDRGRLHRRNEDATAIAIGATAIGAVVCDGVSSAPAPHLASQVAVEAAAAVFAREVESDGVDGRAACVDAIAAADAAVAALPRAVFADEAAPACTCVAALWDGHTVTIASVGDSRAYWIGHDAPRQLTVDDSWAREQVDAGLMTLDEALADARAHAITRWIGPDAVDAPPSIIDFVPRRAGRLVLCSDGLWNHVSKPEQLAALVTALPGTPSPADVARALVRVALDAGGHDNVTVAVIDVAPTIDPPRSSQEES
jgi:serine/threonine protein phosphatase PrpC